MRLYPRTGDVSVVTHPAHGTIKPAGDGGFDLPDELFTLLHNAAHGGVKLWETAIERQTRLIAEEHARRQSPEALYEAVSRLVAAAEGGAPGAAAKAAPAPKAAPAAKAADSK
jgi:hypothetical protein